MVNQRKDHLISLNDYQKLLVTTVGVSLGSSQLTLTPSQQSRRHTDLWREVLSTGGSGVVMGVVFTPHPQAIQVSDLSHHQAD